MASENDFTRLEEEVYQSNVETAGQIDKEIEDAKKKIREKLIAFLALYSNKKSFGKYKTISKEINAIMQSLYDNLESILSRHFDKVGELTEERLKTSLNLNMEAEWALWKYPNGETFKETLQRVKKAVAENITTDLKQSDVLGLDTASLDKKLDKRIKTLRNTVNAIVYTDSSHISSEIVLGQLKKADYKKFRFVAVLDDRTSEMCREMDGQVFSLSQAEIGVNVPPLHPRCRSHIEPIE